MIAPKSAREERFHEAPRLTATCLSNIWVFFITIGASAIVLTVVIIVMARPSRGVGVLAGALCLVAAAVTLWRHGPKKTGSKRPLCRGLILQDTTLYFDNGVLGSQRQKVIQLTSPFGVTLFANRTRSRAALVVTTAEASFYVNAHVEASERTVYRSLLASAFTVANDERALDAAAPDGSALVLPPSIFAHLVETLIKIEPLCRHRFFLTDTRGQSVIWDQFQLTMGKEVFDLTACLQWRATLFRETGLKGVTIYQATHVRQAEQEAAFVSLLPALSAPTSPDDTVATAEPELERAVLRDIRLLQASAEEPPPASIRIGIERVFMLPLRAALHRAPYPIASPTGNEEHSAQRDLRVS